MQPVSAWSLCIDNPTHKVYKYHFTYYQQSIMDFHHLPNQAILSSNTTLSSQSQTFVAMMSQIFFPKKYQAIIFVTIDGVLQKTYSIELSKIIFPTNILFVSRILIGRFCIYLCKKEVVDQHINNNQHITIDNKTIKWSRLRNPDKRIILSNVFPNNPNSPNLDQLLKYNIIPTSPILFLRAGLLPTVSNTYSAFDDNCLYHTTTSENYLLQC